jgi:hypothetical protein
MSYFFIYNLTLCILSNNLTLADAVEPTATGYATMPSSIYDIVQIWIISIDVTATISTIIAA